MTIALPSPVQRVATGVAGEPPAPRGRLFRKYVALLVGLVSLVLVVNGAIDVWFSYGDAKETMVRLQREKAESAARRIETFISEIERQVGWTTHAQWAATPVEQRRFDYVRLLRQVPAITELVQLDGSGREQLKVSRLAMDVIGSNADWSQDPRWIEAQGQRVWFSPVYFRKESEPYLSMSVTRTGRNAGLTVAEVNLKLIWDVVSAIRVGDKGYAYVVDRQGRLIAHPDISLVLRNTDLATLPQVMASSATGAISTPMTVAHGPAGGGRVLSAFAAMPQLGWRVFVELPMIEAMAPLLASVTRTGILLTLGILVATLASIFLARRLVGPIRTIEAGAALVGAGALRHRIDVRTGDELEALASRFNRMAEQLQDSYAGLERKVEERTHELQETLAIQTATGEVLKVISRSTFDLDPVLRTVVETAARLCRADVAEIFRLSEHGDYRHVVSTSNTDPAYDEIEKAARLRPGRGTLVGRTAIEGRTVQIVDALADSEYEAKDEAKVGGVRTMLGVPLIREGTMLGVIVLARRRVQVFTEKEIELVTVFADQSVIAIENVRLLDELQARTGDLARSVEELQALSEVGRAVSSTLDLRTVLATIVSRAVEMAGAEAGAIFRFRKAENVFVPAETHGLDDALVERIRATRIAASETSLGEAVASRTPVQITDLATRPSFPLRDITLAAGFRSVLIVPLMSAERTLGALVLQRRVVGEFPARAVQLMQTFAAQSALAISNARLFREIEDKNNQLEVASRHKSQFLANMSHELRTPLNAILGYTEMLADGIYGELPEKQREVLDRVQSNGRHLLGLINDVLDLAKIEAGHLALAIEDYSVEAMVLSVVAATEPLAGTKGLQLKSAVTPGLPFGRGDERRLTQVLLNLVGNAIKFTDAGEVEITATGHEGWFEIAVRDTGPGIADSDQKLIFEEFQQVDNSSTRKKGGTGLGLAISKKIIEMHGGALTVRSVLGEGSTFVIALPREVEAQREVV